MILQLYVNVMILKSMHFLPQMVLPHLPTTNIVFTCLIPCSLYGTSGLLCDQHEISNFYQECKQVRWNGHYRMYPQFWIASLMVGYAYVDLWSWFRNKHTNKTLCISEVIMWNKFCGKRVTMYFPHIPEETVTEACVIHLYEKWPNLTDYHLISGFL